MKKNLKTRAVSCALAAVAAAACASELAEAALGGRPAEAVALGLACAALACAAIALYRRYRRAAAARVEWEIATGARDARVGHEDRGRRGAGKRR